MKEQKNMENEFNQNICKRHYNIKTKSLIPFNISGIEVYECNNQSIGIVYNREKYEFYTQGPTKETQERGWILPASGKILKSEVNTYIEADKDIIKISLKIGVQQEKIELLDSIIRTLNNRGYNIRAAIDWYKFTMGV
jgi:hypothetical protein